jgi:hypothetical protein
MEQAKLKLEEDKITILTPLPPKVKKQASEPPKQF